MPLKWFWTILAMLVDFDWKKSHQIIVMYMGFHLVFTYLVAGPANKPSTKPATVPPHVPLAHIQRSASPIVARFGLCPMKTKLTEQATVV